MQVTSPNQLPPQMELSPERDFSKSGKSNGRPSNIHQDRTANDTYLPFTPENNAARFSQSIPTNAFRQLPGEEDIASLDRSPSVQDINNL